jgi:hypothetical protein
VQSAFTNTIIAVQVELNKRLPIPDVSPPTTTPSNLPFPTINGTTNVRAS